MEDLETGPTSATRVPRRAATASSIQINLEAIGSADADLDVEVIALGWRLLRRPRAAPGGAGPQLAGRRHLPPGLPGGTAAGLPRRRRRRSCATSTRPAWRTTRCGSSTARQPECVAATADAPRQLDYLCDACQAHFERVRAGLEALGVPYRIDTRLVRGLDYYTRTTFEYAAGWRSSRPRTRSAAEAATTGWSRRWAGPPTPGHRVRRRHRADPAGLRRRGGALPRRRGGAARRVRRRLRRRRRRPGSDRQPCGPPTCRADRAFDGRSAKAQFKAADRSGARLALVIGPDEAAAGLVAIKDLRGEAGGRLARATWWTSSGPAPAA